MIISAAVSAVESVILPPRVRRLAVLARLIWPAIPVVLTVMVATSPESLESEKSPEKLNEPIPVCEPLKLNVVVPL